MARDPGRLACAAESLLRGEPLIATASRVTRWLLVEQPGAWGREALLESRLPAHVARTLDSRAHRFRTRVVLIRRPDRSESVPRQAVLARTTATERWLHTIPVEDPDELMGIDLDAAPPVVEDRSMVLVCTNGRHDPCCADRGRPVVRALRAEGTEDVWESSHVGGDRFAANLVHLPTGVYYGRVDPEGAGELVRRLDAGHIDLDHYRGRSCYTPLGQAAEIFLRRELGETGVDALDVLEASRDGDRGTVVLGHSGGAYRVSVGREKGAPEHLTCSDHGLSQPWSYVLWGIEALDSGAEEHSP